MSVKRCFPLFPLTYPDQVIWVSQIKFRKHAGPLEELEGQIHDEERVFITDSDVIKAMLIDAGAEHAVLLFNKEEPQSERSRGRANYPQRQELVDILLHRPSLRGGQAAKVASR